MLRREIKYKNFDDEEVSDVYYFNISKSELVELEVEFKQGFGSMMQQIIDEKDSHEIIKYFKRIVLMAYGKKSDDGKRFIKNDQLREEFTQTPAYDALFMELATDAEKAAEFIRGALPKDMRADFDKGAAEVTEVKSNS